MTKAIFEAWEVEGLRENAGEILNWEEGKRVEEDGLLNVYGGAEQVFGTGRATCRVCGKKIEKGEHAIKFGYDISDLGHGSHTATTVQIHKVCPNN
jgi:hypothetical protein